MTGRVQAERLEKKPWSGDRTSCTNRWTRAEVAWDWHCRDCSRVECVSGREVGVILTTPLFVVCVCARVRVSMNSRRASVRDVQVGDREFGEAESADALRHERLVGRVRLHCLVGHRVLVLATLLLLRLRCLLARRLHRPHKSSPGSHEGVVEIGPCVRARCGSPGVIFHRTKNSAETICYLSTCPRTPLRIISLSRPLPSKNLRTESTRKIK